MTGSFSKPPDTATQETERPQVRGNTSTAGFVDAFGTRHLKFDHAAGASLEILLVREEFAASPAFEAALRARVDEARHLQHPSLATIHGVERREGDGLCLVSRLTTGRRISELAGKAQGAAFALELLRLVTPALAMLHRSGLAHGAVSGDRIIVTRDGRLVLVDHVFGSAMQALSLTRPQLVELGLAVPATDDPVRFDGRTDMAQLGFTALSLLLGRELEPEDFPARVPALLDEFVRGAGSPVLAGRLRGWLERAMQISPRAFASAREAQDALGDLPDDFDVHVATSMSEVPVKAAVPPARPARVAEVAEPAAAPAAVLPKAPVAQAPVEIFMPLESGIGSLPSPRPGWITAALAVLAGAEAVALAVLLYTRPAPAQPPPPPAPDPVVQSAEPPPNPAAELPLLPPPVGAPPVEPAAAAVVESAAAVVPAVRAETPTATAPPPAAPVPPAPRVGSVTVSSPVTLQVLENGSAIGSTGGAFSLPEGSHTLEFVNEELGFRLHQDVGVRNARMTTVNISVPNGRVSINAVPWAEVFIDGNPVGETPIANLALPIGTHQVVFRHPELGERRQTIVVKVDGLLRVTQSLQLWQRR
jgi:hypothetical protein